VSQKVEMRKCESYSMIHAYHFETLKETHTKTLKVKKTKTFSFRIENVFTMFFTRCSVGFFEWDVPGTPRTHNLRFVWPSIIVIR
jgi:hypothetical protein